MVLLPLALLGDQGRDGGIAGREDWLGGTGESVRRCKSRR